MLVVHRHPDNVSASASYPTFNGCLALKFQAQIFTGGNWSDRSGFGTVQPTKHDDVTAQPESASRQSSKPFATARWYSSEPARFVSNVHLIPARTLGGSSAGEGFSFISGAAQQTRSADRAVEGQQAPGGAFSGPPIKPRARNPGLSTAKVQRWQLGRARQLRCCWRREQVRCPRVPMRWCHSEKPAK